MTRNRSDYARKMKDPRWQRRRLQIFERDDYHCCLCGDGESTLHVHHLFYGDGEPWEAEERHLLTLCEGCHDAETEGLYPALKQLGAAVRRFGMTSGGITELAEAFETARPAYTPDVVASALRLLLANNDAQSDAITTYFAHLAANRPKRNAS